MNKTADLVEQHVRESELRLRHIDEMMDKARRARLEEPAASEASALLSKIQLDRDRLARELEALRRTPAHEAPIAAERGEGLKGALSAIGLQLEQALGAIF